MEFPNDIKLLWNHQNEYESANRERFREIWLKEFERAVELRVHHEIGNLVLISDEPGVLAASSLDQDVSAKFSIIEFASELAQEEPGDFIDPKDCNIKKLAWAEIFGQAEKKIRESIKS